MKFVKRAFLEFSTAKSIKRHLLEFLYFTACRLRRIIVCRIELLKARNVIAFKLASKSFCFAYANKYPQKLLKVFKLLQQASKMTII